MAQLSTLVVVSMPLVAIVYQDDEDVVAAMTSVAKFHPDFGAKTKLLELDDEFS
jgi:hypothetical protein